MQRYPECLLGLFVMFFWAGSATTPGIAAAVITTVVADRQPVAST